MRGLLRPLAIFRQAVQSNRVVQLKHPFTTALVWRAMEDKELLKKRLTPLQYHVTQEAGTERPFTGCYNKCYDEGMYVCIVCRQELFSSKTKYDSGCGWPAFNDVLAQEKVTLHQDTSAAGKRAGGSPDTRGITNALLDKNKEEERKKRALRHCNRNMSGMVRTEVRCSKCSAHLGHVFNDGPAPTKKRFCINSASLDFIPAEERKD